LDERNQAGVGIRYIHMDFPLTDPPQRKPGSFFALLTVYTRLFYIISILSFVTGFLAADLKLDAYALLVLAGISSLLWNGMLCLLYERYLHNQSSYTRTKYSAVVAFGWVAFCLFAFGMFAVVTELYRK
jgi:hypothetical protein